MNIAVYNKIKQLADDYSKELNNQIALRIEEMQKDDTSHFLIYRVLGISSKEGKLIDEYQNKGLIKNHRQNTDGGFLSTVLFQNCLIVCPQLRTQLQSSKTDVFSGVQFQGRFLYKYAGSFLENAAIICLKQKFPDSAKIRIPNTKGNKPSTFEIDCLVNNFAHEIKWRDATTDGDHITKEHIRVSVIKDAGYIPIRVMFYYPQREQAVKIQETLKTLYKGIGGHYYSGDDAWKYIKEFTNIDLLEILNKIADSRKV